MVSVACFGVKVSVIIHLMFVHYTFSSVWVVLIVFCLFVSFIYFPFWFKGGIWLLITPVPVHCFSITFFSRICIS